MDGGHRRRQSCSPLRTHARHHARAPSPVDGRMSESQAGVDLETARLRIRRMTEADAPFIVELLNDPAFLRFIGDKNVRTLADARRYIIEGPIASYARFGFGLDVVTLKADR